GLFSHNLVINNFPYWGLTIPSQGNIGERGNRRGLHMIRRTANPRAEHGESPAEAAQRSRRPATSPPVDPRTMLASLREVVRRAWKPLAALRDPDLHYFRRGGWLFSVVHDVNQAYGYSSAQARSFRPTSLDVSRMEVVMGWMAWLRRTEGDIAIRR